ncbi:MAG: hypothetical protein ACRC62_02235 [Microcoleus sp.]
MNPRRTSGQIDRPGGLDTNRSPRQTGEQIDLISPTDRQKNRATRGGN